MCKLLLRDPEKGYVVLQFDHYIVILGVKQDHKTAMGKKRAG